MSQPRVCCRGKNGNKWEAGERQGGGQGWGWPFAPDVDAPFGHSYGVETTEDRVRSMFLHSLRRCERQDSLNEMGVILSHRDQSESRHWTPS